MLNILNYHEEYAQWEGTWNTITEQLDTRLFFCHPEAFLSCKDGLEVLQSGVYRSARAVIVDEAHFILEW